MAIPHRAGDFKYSAPMAPALVPTLAPVLVLVLVLILALAPALVMAGASKATTVRNSERSDTTPRSSGTASLGAVWRERGSVACGIGDAVTDRGDDADRGQDPTWTRGGYSAETLAKNLAKTLVETPKGTLAGSSAGTAIGNAVGKLAENGSEDPARDALGDRASAPERCLTLARAGNERPSERVGPPVASEFRGPATAQQALPLRTHRRRTGVTEPRVQREPDNDAIGSYFGLSMRDAPFPVAGWVSAAQSEIATDEVTPVRDGIRWSRLRGVDFIGTRPWVSGVAVGIDREDPAFRSFMRATELADAAARAETSELRGWAVAPYVGAALNDWFSVDATVGVSYSAAEHQFGALDSRDEFGPAGEHRWFLSGAANYAQAFGNWLLTATAGLVYAAARPDELVAGRDALPDRAQARFGGEVAYSVGAWQSFGRGILEHEGPALGSTSARGARSLDGGELSVGLRYVGGNGVAAVLEYGAPVGRDHVRDERLNATLRWRW